MREVRKEKTDRDRGLGGWVVFYNNSWFGRINRINITQKWVDLDGLAWFKPNGHGSPLDLFNLPNCPNFGPFQYDMRGGLGYNIRTNFILPLFTFLLEFTMLSFYT